MLDRLSDRSRAAVVKISLGTALLMVACRGAGGQTPPGYQELFGDPPRADQLTPDDLPNMGRLVALEAMSMFVHARAELRTSPDSAALLEQITTLWNAADAFTSALSDNPTELQSVAAGRLALQPLEAAFTQVKQTVGALPLLGRRTAENLADMSRVMAVIGPLLDVAQARVPAPGALALPSIAAQAQDLAVALVPMQAAVKTMSARGAVPATLQRQIELLGKLVEGFERIAGREVSQQDLIASFRPIRNLARSVGQALVPANLGATGSNLWRSIEQITNAMETRFQLPREIVPRPAGGKDDLPDPATTAPLDRAIRDAETVANHVPPEAQRLPRAGEIQSTAKSLATQLYLVRQYVLGQAPRELLNKTLAGLELSRRRLDARIALGVPGSADELKALSREVNDAIEFTRKHLAAPPSDHSRK